MGWGKSQELGTPPWAAGAQAPAPSQLPPGSALAGSWSQELGLGVDPRNSDLGHGRLSQ